MRTFPHLEFWDFNKNEIEKSHISVANIQIETPDNLFSNTIPPILNSKGEKTQKEKIQSFLEETTTRKADLIVLPELSISEKMCLEMKNNFSDTQSIIVMGSHYDNISQNVAYIFFDGNFYGQTKNNPSFEEKEFMRPGKDISVFINTPIGDFAVLICYDATDFSILSSLQDYVDFLICIARTKDTITFRNIFKAVTYLQYQYVIFCNDAKYGGSSFYLPFHGNREVDTLGIKNEGVIYRNFDIRTLDKMRCLNREKDELYKYPPATSKPRHIPLVKKEARRKEYFESTSFNYLSYIRSFDILINFLTQVNTESLSSSELGGSIYRLEDVLLKSIKGMYAPGIVPRAGTFKQVILKYFLLDLIELVCEDNKLLLEDKNKNKNEIIKRLSKIHRNQYLLFEINLKKIIESLSNTPELFDEIFRILSIEKRENIRKIPSNLKIEISDTSEE